MILRVLKKSYIPTLSETKKRLGPRFNCHPNGIVLKVLNRKRSRKSPFRAVVSTRCGTVPHALHQSTILLSSSTAAPLAASMVKMEAKTNRNAEQRVKQLKRVKQHYSHAHHWLPQQQYKSKRWTIAIILKLTFVAWDSWTDRIGY